ncbi:T9SS type B sorting domain-containing protein [Hymenobacter properus]|uniref:Gliding motility-associated C-terminal domain-containing protein n=1 Tax=Hymenobacter properus TaxID=2791026 RepID=A0A931FKF9_9BACT|nr:gliding motility-associated C-terminal domain-containing protein [Hymenobacter properus]MBF9140956.1 gliding motility-associated C-terminal domain-containing protein [Hymenobacter properus]MBR7719765.1 gliding motility-associated C-terminal domain-containing protein [Microvirga sp. SRT04]
MIASLLLRARAWVWTGFLLLLVSAGLRPETAQASHIRAGFIQAKADTTIPGNPRRVFFKMILYTTTLSTGTQPPVDEDKVTIFFGDGTSSCYRGIDRVGGRQPIPLVPDTGLNVYVFEHIYPSVGPFTVRYTGENRIAGVRNMDNSSAQSFYISTTVYIYPELLGNRSPVITSPSVDKGAVRQVFTYNPGAYDADGDSLVYSLRPSKKVSLLAQDIVGLPCSGATGNNTPVPVTVPNFHYPNHPSVTPGTRPEQVAYNGSPPGVPGDTATFVQDIRTGQVTWNAPAEAGIYNFAFSIRELRRTPLGWREIGEIISDVQVIIVSTNNLRPTLTIPADICVVAGQTVTGVVTAVDGLSQGSTAQTPVSLFAYSGIKPPATFVQSTQGPPQARGVFTWQTQCSNVARLPYLVVFKAQDTPPGSGSTTTPPANQPLIDEQVWRITVVGPPPQNLRATAATTTGGLNRTVLNWDAYTCTNASTIYIYRKVGPGPSPGPCETGIPPSSGYVRIGSVNANVTTFNDDNLDASGVARGLARGLTYCYRIYADFPLPALGSSLASAEACVTFAGRSAQLKNVDVEATSTNAGQIAVRWTTPRTTTGVAFDGTPSYVLSRGEGLAPTTFTTVRTFTSLTDTSYVDTGLNTMDRQYTYRLDFVRTFTGGQPSITETLAPASSVRTTVVANNPPTAFTVSWTYNVPWDNTARPVTIYRRVDTPGSTFVPIATAPTGPGGGTYLDNSSALVPRQSYCYYVRTEGRYAAAGYLSSLLNKSQEQCRQLIAPPCTPVLALQAVNCDSLAALPQPAGTTTTYTNRLRWTLSNAPTGCDANVASYRVYYREGTAGAFTLLTTTTQTTFIHANLPTSGGCYAVQAVGNGGTASDTSNVACQDNCLFFSLPNIFTPNGDNQNAVFRPKNNSPVRSVHFQAFNRWGRKVFENTTTASDPVLINWDGGGPVNGDTAGGRGNKVADGIYFYLAEVEFADTASTKRTYKGWVEIVR